MAFTGAHLTDQGSHASELDAWLYKKLNIAKPGYEPDALTAARIWKHCRDNEDFFIFNFVRTRDEHDAESPVKPFPDWPYLREILHHIRSYPITAIAKSRQMTVTWLLTAHAIWHARFWPHRLIFIQSKKEEDAANLVFNQDWVNARGSFIELNLPKFLRMRGLKAKYGQLFYPNGSHIWGIPQGSHIIRSYTASEIIMDEAAFQPQFEEAYTAALATVKGGGRLVACSTALANTFFAKICGQDENDD